MSSTFFKNIAFPLVVATALALVAPVHTARATTFAPLTVEQMTDASDRIVRGDVQEVWTEIDDAGGVWTRARVAVTETLKGPDAQSELIIDSLGGTHNGHTTGIVGQAVFSEYEQLLVFLSLNKEGRLVPVSKFLGKYTVRRAPDTDRSHLMTYHPRVGVKFDARFLPHPVPEERIYLDDVEAEVRDRLDVGWRGEPIPGVAPAKLEQINTPAYRIAR